VIKKSVFLGFLGISIILMTFGIFYISEQQKFESVYFDLWLTQVNSHRTELGFFQDRDPDSGVTVEPGFSFKLLNGTVIYIKDVRLTKVDFDSKKSHLAISVWVDRLSNNEVQSLQFSEIDPRYKSELCNQILITIENISIVHLGQLISGEDVGKRIKSFSISFTAPFSEEAKRYKVGGMILNKEWKEF